MLGRNWRSSITQCVPANGSLFELVHGEFLRRHGRLIKSTTVLPPAIGFETHTSGFRRCDRSFSFQSRMTAIPVVVVSKCEELRLQIQSSPKQHLVQTFSA